MISTQQQKVSSDQKKDPCNLNFQKFLSRNENTIKKSRMFVNVKKFAEITKTLNIYQAKIKIRDFSSSQKFVPLNNFLQSFVNCDVLIRDLRHINGFFFDVAKREFQISIRF